MHPALLPVSIIKHFTVMPLEIWFTWVQTAQCILNGQSRKASETKRCCSTAYLLSKKSRAIWLEPRVFGGRPDGFVRLGKTGGLPRRRHLSSLSILQTFWWEQYGSRMFMTTAMHQPQLLVRQFPQKASLGAVATEPATDGVPVAILDRLDSC